MPLTFGWLVHISTRQQNLRCSFLAFQYWHITHRQPNCGHFTCGQVRAPRVPNLDRRHGFYIWFAIRDTSWYISNTRMRSLLGFKHGAIGMLDFRKGASDLYYRSSLLDLLDTLPPAKAWELTDSGSSISHCLGRRWCTPQQNQPISNNIKREFTQFWGFPMFRNQHCYKVRPRQSCFTSCLFHRHGVS